MPRKEFSIYLPMATSLKEFEEVLSHCKASIGYRPMKDEPSYRGAKFLFPILKKELRLPSDKKSDPLKWAARCAELYQDGRVCIFVPGQRFDVYGTRHGRGGGWYDRFLSAVPRSWLRIGVTDTSRLYLYPIKKQSWDEPVDWIMVQSSERWRVYKTGARVDSE